MDPTSHAPARCPSWVRTLRRLCPFALLVAFLGLAAGWPVGHAGAAPTGSGVQGAPVRASLRALLRDLDPRKHHLEHGRLVTPLGDGRRALLTLDPALQASVESLFDRYQVPHAGLVAVEPATGRLLAYVSHSSADPEGEDMARDASAPAASVFKLITTAALLEHGVGPRTTTCYHGGYSSIERSHLHDHAAMDKACVSLKTALGFSVNAVFAKLATRHLSEGDLLRYASAFGFGHALPFDVAARTSALSVPGDDLEFARAAAGFWHSRMSPLHGAMIAATIANRGRMMRPHLVDEVIGPHGHTLARQSPTLFRAVVGRGTAELLGDMMTTTVARGTARKTFFDAEGNAFLPGIEVAGKTGTLSEERPYRGYSWWVGFAPARAPRIAVAALLVNSPKWRIKAPYAAREALRHYLVEQPRARAAK